MKAENIFENRSLAISTGSENRWEYVNQMFHYVNDRKVLVLKKTGLHDRAIFPMKV